ncbi:MAG: hypothetical protein AAF648_15815 [Pseudomonadota bacterium]
MLSTVRVYDSNETVDQVIAQLREMGLRSDTIHPIGPHMGPADSVVRAAVQSEHLPWAYRNLCTGLVAEGRTVLVVEPPFGQGRQVESIMDGFNPLAVTFPAVRRSSPAPLSDFLGIPLLKENRAVARMSLSHNPAPLSSWFGWSMLSSNATPFSSRFGMKLLTRPKANWTQSFGFPMLWRRKASWNSSFGFPVLSRSSTPLSSLFGMPLLSEKTPSDDSFGFPLLSRDATPFSSRLGWPLLTDEAFNEDVDKQESQ